MSSPVDHAPAAIPAGVLEDLCARLERATGPDRDLDDDIAVRVAGFSPTLTLGHELLGNRRRVPQASPRYTASLDDAIGVAKRLFPGWAWGVRDREVDPDAAIGTVMSVSPYRWFEKRHRLPTHALLLAILSAIRDADANGGERHPSSSAEPDNNKQEGGA